MQAGGDVCALSGIGAQKLDRVDVEREGEFLQHIDGGGIFFAFQHADVIAVDLGKMGKLLSRKYNRARQAQITTELTEIISGAQALE